MFRSALLILSGNAVASLINLVRNLLIARLLPVADYGIAATFAVAMSMVEMASAFGLQQQIVQARDGDDPRLQAGLQGFQVLRGLVAGAALFLLAGPFAWFLGSPQLAPAYQVLALVPVLTALTHFDVYRLTRQMRYRPIVVANAVPPIVSLVAVWPLFHWLGDYRVMLGALLVQALAMTVTSHLVAERGYRVSLDREVMRRGWSFGWPLLINNIMLFFVFQGDKMLVGRELGFEALAIFAMGVTLTLTPTLVMAKSLQSYFLPQLSAAGDDPARFSDLAHAAIQASMLAAAVLLLAVFLAGEAFIQMALGPKYKDLVPIFTMLAAVHAVQVLKSAPSTIALARGQTGNAAIGNVFRVSSFPIIWIVLLRAAQLEHIIWIAFAAECAGVTAAFFLVRQRVRLSLRSSTLTFGALFAVVITAVFKPFIGGMEETASVPATLFLFFCVQVASSRQLGNLLILKADEARLGDR